MKILATILITLFATCTLSAQDVVGKWHGVLNIQGIKLRLDFHVEKTESGYSSTMDSPDQNAFGIPVTNTILENLTITFQVKNAAIEYVGELKEDEILGTFKQAGQEFPLNLSRNEIEKEILNRPQEPKAPFPYYTEEVSFENYSANITLSGTLTLPKKEGKYPVVVLISGSGPQDRNEEILGHKPFLVIADYLTKNGIGVLRYDDRGVGKSAGNYSLATSADLALDTESAISYLKTRKEINQNKIGLIGHSEGGLIAPLIASKSNDIDFIVLMAGPGIRGDKVLLLQQGLIAKANGASEADIEKLLKENQMVFDLINNSNNDKNLNEELKQLLTELLQNEPTFKSLDPIKKEELIAQRMQLIVNPWMLFFLNYDPAFALEKVQCPVLAINGEKDLQVPPKENLSAIKNALEKGGNKKVAIKEFSNLNHLFQECTTGSPSEYATIEETISPKVLAEISQWIKTNIEVKRTPKN